MALHKYMERIKFTDSLILKKATGSPKDLATRLGISRSVLFELINEMKGEGFPIAYSKMLNSYYYTEEGKLTEHLFEKTLSRRDMKAINGGKSFFKIFSESDYTGL